MSEVMKLPEIKEKDQLLLAKKNKMLNVLENEGSQIAVVGDTSTGKSTTINFLLGFPVNFEAAGIGTRRPCVICQEYKEDAETVTFKVVFTKGGHHIDEPCSHVHMVRKRVEEANTASNTHFFDCIQEEQRTNNRKLPDSQVFDDEPIYVTMYHKSFKYGLRLIDLPGLTRDCQAPLRIAEKYIQKGNIAVLVIGRDMASNAQFPLLAGKMADCSKVIFMQNFALKVLDSLDNNIKEIKDELKKVGRESGDKDKIERCDNLAKDMVLYLTEYGYPCKPEFKANGLWKEGEGQQDWLEMSRSHEAKDVREAMWEHANARAEALKRDNPRIVQDKVRAGLQEPLNDIIEYQLSNLSNQITDMEKLIEAKYIQQEILVNQLEKETKSLTNPPEWSAMLESVAQTISKFLDTTLEVRHENYKKGEHSYNKEPLTGFVGANTAQEKAECGVETWTGKEETDKAITEMLAKHTNFEANVKLLCLRSWVRLLDEFTGMLAFAPMNTIKETRRQNVMEVITQSMTGRKDPAEGMLQCIIAENQQVNGVEPIRHPILYFQRRLLKLVERDIGYAMKIFAQDETGEITRFLRAVGVEEEDMVTEGQELVEVIRTTIINEVTALVHKTVQGEEVVNMDERSTEKYKMVNKPDGARPQVKENSGMAVRTDENNFTPKGFVHWILPFKSHYLNGQLPWRDLAWTQESTGQGIDPPDPKETVDPKAPDIIIKEVTDDLREEITSSPNPQDSYNLINGMNLRMYSLSTKMYDVDLMIGSANTTDYELEAMKLLKAMQAEVSSFWAAKKMRVIQDLFNMSKIGPRLKALAKKKCKKQNVEDTDAIERAIETVMRVLVGEDGNLAQGWFTQTEWPDKFLKSTTMELQDLESDMARDTSGFYNGRKKPWNGGMLRDVYIGVLQDFCTQNPNLTSPFPFNHTHKLCCRRSWMRINDEFLFLMMQLAMRPVTDEEVSLAKVSTGDSLTSSPQEIVGKLVLHRLRETGREGGTHYKDRMLHAYDRDTAAGMEHLDGFVKTTFGSMDIAGQSPQEFFKEGMHTYCAELLDKTKGEVMASFDQLLPFDWSSLNGRLPLLKVEKGFRKKPWLYNAVDEKCEEKDCSQENEEYLTKPLQDMWVAQRTEEEYLKGQMLVGATSNKNDSRGEKAPLTCTNAVKQESYMNLAVDAFKGIGGSLETPEFKARAGFFNELAPPRFQEKALLVWKAMHAAAIDYCRPKLKKMLSDIYSKDSLLRILRDAPSKGETALDFRARYGGTIDAKIERFVAEQGKLKRLENMQMYLRTGQESHIAGEESKADKLADQNATLQAELDRKAAEFQNLQAEKAEKEAAALAEQNRLAAVLDAARRKEHFLETEGLRQKPLAVMGEKYLALDTIGAQYKLSIEEFSLQNTDITDNQLLTFNGYYFKKEGWWGKGVKETASRTPDSKDIKAYQHLFETFKLGTSHIGHHQLQVTKSRLDSEKFSSVDANIDVVGLDIPPLFPWHEHFICIECWVAEKGSFFRGAKPAEKVFCVVFPLAYALHPDRVAQKTTDGKGLQELWAQVKDFQFETDLPFKMEDGNSFIFKEGKGLTICTKDKSLESQFQRAQIELKMRVRFDANDYAMNLLSSAEMTESGEYQVGQEVEYWSRGRNQYFPTKIKAMKPDGSMQLEIHHDGRWISKGDQSRLVRLKPGAGGGAAAPAYPLKVGDKVEYHSRGMNKWLPTEITAVHPDGTVEVAVKPGAKVPKDSVRKA